jgi:hypothetical protein
MLSIDPTNVAFLAVFVSAASVAATTWSNVKAQRTTQVNEALRRLGEMNSVHSRASAAVTLAQLAQPRMFWERRSGDYPIAALQLCMALRLESEQSVVDAITEALLLMVRKPSSDILRMIQQAEIEILDQLVRSVAGLMGHVKLWMSNHQGFDGVSEIEQEVYKPLLDAAGNFDTHPSSAIEILTGENIVLIQKLVLDKTIVEWRKTIVVESVSFGSGLTTKRVQEIRRSVRLGLRKLRACHNLRKQMGGKEPMAIRMVGDGRLIAEKHH